MRGYGWVERGPVDLRGAELADHKRVLAALLEHASGIQLIKYVDPILGDGELVLQHVCKLGLEGIVSKRADATYRSGRRTDWTRPNARHGRKRTRIASRRWKVQSRDALEARKKPRRRGHRGRPVKALTRGRGNVPAPLRPMGDGLA